MKTIYLVRHAKSSWDFPELDDFNRPLNDRGKKDAPRIGKYLHEMGISPDLFISSPAERAIKTAKKVTAEFGVKPAQIVLESSLYHAWPDRLLKVITEQNDAHSSVMLFGHNPGLTEVTNLLCGADIENIPTAGVVGISFAVDYWRNVSYKEGTLLFFQYPKGLAKGV